MKGISEGFQNENEKTAYPFSSSCSLVSDSGAVLPHGIFSDAVVYPVVEPGDEDVVRMSRLSPGEVTLVCGEKVLRGSWLQGAHPAVIDLANEDGKPAGTLLPGPDFADFDSSGQTYEFEERRDDAVFAAAACCPLVRSGVSSIAVSGRSETSVLKEPVVVFQSGGSGAVRPQVYESDGKKYLKFDVVPHTSPTLESTLPYIRRILVVGEGRTLLDAMKDSTSVGSFYLFGLTRDDICSAANREESASISRNLCENPEPGCTPEDIPVSGIRFWLYPSTTGGVSLIAPDSSDRDNALNIRDLPGGGIYQQPVSLDPDLSPEEALDEVQKAFDTPISSGHGIMFEVPGSAGKGSAAT